MSHQAVHNNQYYEWTHHKIMLKEPAFMFKKYISEHMFYFIVFVALSTMYIVYGYASLATNDDWALRGMLAYEGIYGTLIMSYPFSYVMSHLYDMFPTFPWYSSLLSLIIAINFYLVAHYIKKNTSYVQKLILFILAILWLTFLWFNTSITLLTITTMISAVGLIRYNLLLSFIFVLLASLLRTDMMIIFMPYYAVSYFILRDHLKISKKEILGFIALIIFVGMSLFIQKQDKQYMNWLEFNKARSAIVDMGILNVDKDYFTYLETFIYRVGWFQDKELLTTEKLVATTPPFTEVLQNKIQGFDLNYFIRSYKFKHWLWILLAGSFLIMLVNMKNRRVMFVPIFVFGVVLLLVTRDVERVTVPLIMLWAYVVFESLKPYKVINTLFLFLFTSIFYYYASGQHGYRYYKENTLLQKEARDLMKQSNKICEVSMNYPTAFSRELNTVFQANYLFRENSWLQLNDKEILPTGWLVRHEFFYDAHDLSDNYTKRKYETYYDYLIDDKTAFFGSRRVVKRKNFKLLLNEYDKRYLEDRPGCRHETFIVKESKHFAISQIRVKCE
jgi:hypothetical protein